MTTLTVTKVRKNLAHWLRKAREGEDIGIIDGDTIIALRPVQVEATDYAAREYGMTTRWTGLWSAATKSSPKRARLGKSSPTKAISMLSWEVKLAPRFLREEALR